LRKLPQAVVKGEPSFSLIEVPTRLPAQSPLRLHIGSCMKLFGTTRFFSLTAGARLYFGGGPMRMGSYGVLDAMSEMASPASSPGDVHRHD
jgi:hypothetical protein